MIEEYNDVEPGGVLDAGRVCRLREEHKLHDNEFTGVGSERVPEPVAVGRSVDVRRKRAGRLMKLLVTLVLASSAVVPTAVPGQTTFGLPLKARQQQESVEALLQKADKGDAQSQYELAVHYATSRSGQLASNEAVHWLRRAAEQGHAEAQSDLGRLYYLGDGVPRDFAQAAEWYRKAAEQGLAEAQYNLAGLYSDGEGVSANPSQAVKWYREAAGRGLAEAQYALAVALVGGEGARKNLAEAARWARGAAVQGHAQA